MTKRKIEEGALLWTPSPERLASTNMVAYMKWLEETRGLKFDDYWSLWRWSVDDLEAFWASIWEYFDIEASAPFEKVLGRREMPGAEWFPGAKLNYAQHMLRQEKPGKTAMVVMTERAPVENILWDELGAKVRIVATQLRDMGVKPGDRVVSCMPNIPATAIAMIATTAIGAVWSSCSPDFGARSVLDRFSQIAPKVMFCVDGYQYGGKPFDRRHEMIEIVSELPTLEHVICLSNLHADAWSVPGKNTVSWADLTDLAPINAEDFAFEQLPFSHPIWILFSSGTTGLPKAIVHSHGGIILEQLKLQALQKDVHPGDHLFFYTTTGWMMWNYLISSILVDAVPVLYDGNPAYPAPDQLWKLAEESQAASFGASPTFVQMMEAAGIVPKDKFDFSHLRTVTLAGSPVTPEVMAWMYENVKEDMWASSGSGGTDVCTGFVEGIPLLPIRAGVIQGAALGVAAAAYDDDGNKIVDEVGEMVIEKPMPSMPVCFWNDEDGSRYRESYFDMYPGVWRQGDFFKQMKDGGCFVLGRSDATLNRYGIRIGTAEIYRTIESLPEIEDSLILNLDLPGGKFFMPLFVKLAEGLELNEAIEGRICAKLRNDYTARHVPDKIYQVAEIPYTLTNKKMEVPVRKILMGQPVDKAANTGAMMNPSALDFFVSYRETQTDFSLD